jgi:hypothetical protein
MNNITIMEAVQDYLNKRTPDDSEVIDAAEHKAFFTLATAIRNEQSREELDKALAAMPEEEDFFREFITTEMFLR